MEDRVPGCQLFRDQRPGPYSERSIVVNLGGLLEYERALFIRLGSRIAVENQRGASARFDEIQKNVLVGRKAAAGNDKRCSDWTRGWVGYARRVGGGKSRTGRRESGGE